MYSLGHSPSELARLDRQAAWLEPATRLLLTRAGIGSGMHVLDLGTGLGHVARIAGDLVAPSGRVIGIDRAHESLIVARERAAASGARHISFMEADAAEWRRDEPFDAVTGRLVLFHTPDPVGIVRHQLQNLRAGGIFVAIDYDAGAARAEPPVPLVTEALGWIERAFSAAGASPRIGARLGTILNEAGLDDVTTWGILDYPPVGSPFGPALFAGVARSLADVITRQGIATPEQLGIDTLETRIAADANDKRAVIIPPAVVGAWGTKRG